MRYVGLIFAWLVVAAFFAGVLWVWICLIRGTLQRRKAREAVRQRVREAREKILADGKIEGPKGKYKPRRWARKWVDYANSIPAPSAQSKSMPRVRELPGYPHLGEE